MRSTPIAPLSVSGVQEGPFGSSDRHLAFSLGGLVLIAVLFGALVPGMELGEGVGDAGEPSGVLS